MKRTKRKLLSVVISLAIVISMVSTTNLEVRAESFFTITVPAVFNGWFAGTYTPAEAGSIIRDTVDEYYASDGLGSTEWNSSLAETLKSNIDWIGGDDPDEYRSRYHGKIINNKFYISTDGQYYAYLLCESDTMEEGTKWAIFAKEVPRSQDITYTTEDIYLSGIFGQADVHIDVTGGAALTPELTPTPSESAPAPEPKPDMVTVNIDGATYNTWEEITANTPSLTAEKLHKVNASNDDLLHVNIVGKEDKTVPATAVAAMDKSSIGGLHVFIGESDAVTFLNNLDYSKYTGMNFKHEDEVTDNSRTIDFTSKGKLNAVLVFHTLIVPNTKANVYKVVDGNEVFLATLSSNENGGFCFAIDELAKYVIKY